MPTYPTGLKTFTRQVDVPNPQTGDTYVNADDINKLQEEVEAIEQELGTTPSDVHTDVTTRLAGIENDGELFVVDDKKIRLSGSAGDEYIMYNSTDDVIETWFGGVLTDKLEAAQLPFLETGAPVGTVAVATAQGFFHKIFVPRHLVVTEISFDVTSAAGSGKLAEVGIYDAAGTTLIDSATAIVIDTTGVKTGTVDATLAPGYYWVGISVEEAATLRGQANGGLLRTSSHTGQNVAAYPLPSAVPTLTANDGIVSLEVTV